MKFERTEVVTGLVNLATVETAQLSFEFAVAFDFNNQVQVVVRKYLTTAGRNSLIPRVVSRTTRRRSRVVGDAVTIAEAILKIDAVAHC